MTWEHITNSLGMKVVSNRLIAAVSTIPNTQVWLQTAALLLAFTIIALPIGFPLEFLQFEILKTSWQKIISIIATSLLMPAITEELIFRVLLLPRSTENASMPVLWLWLSLSLVTFIAYHPLNALSFFRQGVDTFFNAVFLTLAALLGITCSIAYLHSGSLWPPVVIHWLTVVVWLLFLGGYRKLYCQQ